MSAGNQPPSPSYLPSATAVQVPKIDGEIPPTAWPESWFHPPRKASEVGLTRFRRSPSLDALVAAGELPPVAERLPDDPIVVEPIDEIGTYGGTAKLFQAGEQLLAVPEGTLRPGPQLQRTLPNFAAKAEYSNACRTLTLTLRPGHKWSDGHPLTADDFLFWFEHVQMNKSLTPVVSPRFKGARIEKHGPHSFSYHFPQPMPLFVKHLAHNSSHLSVPAHFMRRYHPRFTDGRMILRALDPTAGEIFFRQADGRVVDMAQLSRRQIRSVRSEMQMVFQDPYASLNPRMPVLDLISEPLAAHGWSPRQREMRVRELMERVGLETRYMRRYPHAFSGGQRQRIGIARALALGPSLIVADEPVSALDVSVQAQILNLLQELQADLDLTMLFIAHDLSVVRYLCDEVAVMYKGRLVELSGLDGGG